jgi:hypothetical protein
VCYKRQQQQNKELFTSSLPTSCTKETSPSVTNTTGTDTATNPSAIAEKDKETRPAKNTASTDVCCDETSKAASLSCENTTSVDTEDAASLSAAEAASSSSSSPRPVQKNKKRCFVCKARLELAFVEIGRCKCGYTFCELHRLPEQHECTFDHKETGRQEARDKMISPKKHVGTSLKRLDSDT